MNIELEKEIRANLYLEDREYNQFWKGCKYFAIKAHNLAMKNKNFSYCLESDLQREEDYYEEEGKQIEVVKNYNGVVVYKIIKKERKKDGN